MPLPGRPSLPSARWCKPSPALLFDENDPAGIINAEMGTGKTMMAIAAAAVAHAEGYQRSLVICPPHLVYKWRREIKQTVPNARVWVLNGPDTLKKLLTLRQMRAAPLHPEFFVMGRVRMRMGYHWKPAFNHQARPGAGARRRVDDSGRVEGRRSVRAVTPGSPMGTISP
jgi:hypothetical protein